MLQLLSCVYVPFILKKASIVPPQVEEVSSFTYQAITRGLALRIIIPFPLLLFHISNAIYKYIVSSRTLLQIFFIY